MRNRVRLEFWLIVLLLAAEAIAFSGSLGKFFNHDSLFYVIHAPGNWEQARETFTAPDSSRQYRPLTLVFMAPFVRIWGSNPAPYHSIPLFFHLCNTWLLYRLATRLVRSRVAPVAAAYFWGLHSVAPWVTYDVTCVSDFLSAFLLFAGLILAIDGSASGSRLRAASAWLFAVLALFTKETATTFPLAFLLCLVLARIREEGEPWRWSSVRSAVRAALPLTALTLAAAVAAAGLLVYWLRAGVLYTQGSAAAYDIGPLANLAAKTRYAAWALNLPDRTGAGGKEAAAFLFAGVLLAAWIIDVARRRLKLTALEWGGLAWFAGLCLPALMLSTRLAKWYLYVPLAGVALAFGGFAAHAWRRLSPRFPMIHPAVPALTLALSFAYTAAVHARVYLKSSDAAYVSDSLAARLTEFAELVPGLSRGTTVFFLPDFEDTGRLLSSPPLEGGALFALRFRDLALRALFASRGHTLPPDFRSRDDVRVVQYLDRRFHDVTRHMKARGSATLFVLRTQEGRAPPLLESAPAGGRELYERYVRVASEDRGDRLPDGYAQRSDLWIVQYINGHFHDVTDYFKGRRLAPSRRAIQGLDGLQVSVSRGEYYPDYERFQTPTGKAAFFPTPQREILTQIGGSTVTARLGELPPRARLRLDVSWMNDSGDGGWAELRLRTGPSESTLYREYMKPNPKGSGFRWKEVVVDLGAFAGRDAELVLRCHNEPGGNTVSDWLNWRDIVVEEAARPER